MNTHAGYSKKTLTDTNVLLAGGGDKSLADFLGGIQYVSASHKIQYRAANTNTWTDLVTLVSSGDFVTSLGINGDQLIWVKNGANNELTIPYAIKAALDSNGRSLVTYKEYSGTFPPNDGTLQWYTLVSYTNTYYSKSAIIEISTRRATAAILINFYNTNTPYITFLGYYGSPAAAQGGFTGGVRVIADGNNAKILFLFYAASGSSTYRQLGIKVYSEIPANWVLADSPLVADTATYDSPLANVKAVNGCLTGGGLMPTATNNYNIGSSSFVYKNVYATTFHGALDGNASTATKLQTARTIWGQSFNGTANVSGNMTSVGNITSSSSYSLRDSSTNPYLNLKVGSQNWYVQSMSDGIYVGSTSAKALKVDINGNLTISHTTNAIMTAASTNPKITFAESGAQPVHLTYTDYDSYRNPAGLKVVGGTDASPAWFEAEGNMYAANFYTTSDRVKKQNITTFSEHIRKFQLKDTEKWHYGVIALEVEEMFREGEEGNMTVNYNSVLSFYIGLLENRVKELEDKLKRYEEIQNI